MYHVVGANWIEGSDILSRFVCQDRGLDPGEYIWDGDEADYADADIVSLFDTLADAEAFRDEWRPGTRIVEVEPGQPIRRNAEGYKCVIGYIAADDIIGIVS